MMYEKDKLTRVTVRFNEEQTAFLDSYSKMLGVSISELLRMMVNSGMVTNRQFNDKMVRLSEQDNAIIQEELRRENEQTDFDSKL